MRLRHARRNNLLRNREAMGLVMTISTQGKHDSVRTGIRKLGGTVRMIRRGLHASSFLAMGRKNTRGGTGSLSRAALGHPPDRG
jgi:hypothetical protein